jgi:ATP-dependent Clp protease adaptor protein ClpS
MSRSEDAHSDTAVASRAQRETRTPKLYRVVLLNDDYTTMDFVVFVLVSLFGHSLPAATRIMLDVHTRGAGLAGVYPRSVAETKVSEVLAIAERNDMPLQARAEPDDDGGGEGAP